MELTQKEIELLKKPIPQNPCRKCVPEPFCTCNRVRKYWEKMTPYQEAGIFNVACDISTIFSLMDEIKEKEEKIKMIKAKLPKKVLSELFE